MHFVPLSPGRSWSTLPTAVWTRRCTAWWGPTGACLCWRATELCFDQTWTTWGAKLPSCREGGQDTNQHMEVGVKDISKEPWPRSVFLSCSYSLLSLRLLAGYVGAGMLSAAVAGGVFASPPPASILAAILSLHNAGDEHLGPELLINESAVYVPIKGTGSTITITVT